MQGLINHSLPKKDMLIALFDEAGAGWISMRRQVVGALF
jgi:hypothetical protein